MIEFVNRAITGIVSVAVILAVLASLLRVAPPPRPHPAVARPGRRRRGPDRARRAWSCSSSCHRRSSWATSCCRWSWSGTPSCCTTGRAGPTARTRPVVGSTGWRLGRLVARRRRRSSSSPARWSPPPVRTPATTGPSASTSSCPTWPASTATSVVILLALTLATLWRPAPGRSAGRRPGRRARPSSPCSWPRPAIGYTPVLHRRARAARRAPRPRRPVGVDRRHPPQPRAPVRPPTPVTAAGAARAD